jgi:hypothetical protein
LIRPEGQNSGQIVNASFSCTVHGARRFVFESPHGARIVFDCQMVNDPARMASTISARVHDHSAS